MDESKGEILELISSLQFKDIFTIQKLLNGFVSKTTNVRTSLLALALPDSSEQGLVISVVGDKLLPNALQFMPLEFGLTFDPMNETGIMLEDEHPFKNLLAGILEEEIGRCFFVPVYKPKTQDLALVAVLVDRNDEDDFTEADASNVQECFRYTLGILLGAVDLEEEKRLRNQCQSLLAVAENLFSHLDDVELLLKEIMTEARSLTQAERCSLFLLDKQRKCLVAKVFDSSLQEDQNNQPTLNGESVGIPVNQGIAGHVASTGELLNIKDAYSHPLFYSDIDKSTGFKTRNILCFPIKDGKEVLGVAELCNKTSGTCFTRFDEEVATAFSIYCGISLVHGLMYKKVLDAQHRSHLSNELMMYHMKVSHEEMQKLATEDIEDVQSIAEGFCEFDFLPRSLSDPTTTSAVVAIFQDLGFLQRWKINRETLARFVLMVKKAYRDPPYHNWVHAFSVLHFCYLLIKKLQLIQRGYLSEIEALALIVASLCHDVDHRGTTNSFQLASNSVLAELYSSEGSVMERHHFAQSVCILNTEGCNIFENLSSSDYTTCLDFVQEIILATDLSRHLRILSEQREMAQSGYDKSDPNHRWLLLFLMMTAADLSDQTKDWLNSKNTALLVYREFFSQGDLEKAMGNSPLEMMDRDKACIPALQIRFIDDIVSPVYSLLFQIFPEAGCLLESVQHNREEWSKLRGTNLLPLLDTTSPD